MNNIEILDCTLRDGGYVNDWKFGYRTIKTIISKLDDASIDIIEVGFLSEKIKDEDYSLYSSIDQIRSVMPKTHRSMYVGMIAIGEKEIHPSRLTDFDGKSIDGIRLTFHQHEIDKALEWANIIKQKGYKVFMQPIGTIFYTDSELLSLVESMNQLQPYAFYIVDTLGSMYRDKLLYMFYLIDSNLDTKIKIGFHAHNNLQLAFSNAQELSRIHTKRCLILDSSVYGMGRGAGNLPTELITQFINANVENKYDHPTILDIYDENISLIRQDYEWGYSMPYHIAANNICHPNYASFLINRQTLTMKDIEQIIGMIPKQKRAIFDKKLIDNLYIEYQDKKLDDKDSLMKMTKVLENRDVLVLAPGKTLSTEYDKIEKFINKNNPYVIAVNFFNPKYSINACFVSNHKRKDSIEIERKTSRDILVIATSNIRLEENINNIYIDYYSYTNPDEIVFDNAGLMLFKFLQKCGVNEIALAGFDGFKTRYNENYYSDNMSIQINQEELEDKQVRIGLQLKEINSRMKITFLTNSIYAEVI